MVAGSETGTAPTPSRREGHTRELQESGILEHEGWDRNLHQFAPNLDRDSGIFYITACHPNQTQWPGRYPSINIEPVLDTRHLQETSNTTVNLGNQALVPAINPIQSIIAVLADLQVISKGVKRSHAPLSK